MDRVRSILAAGVVGFIVGVFLYFMALLVIHLSNMVGVPTMNVALVGVIVALAFIVIDLVTGTAADE